jgi:hypothetical protein
MPARRHTPIRLWAILIDIVRSCKSHQSSVLTIYVDRYINKNIIHRQFLIIGRMKIKLITILRWILRVLSSIIILFFLFMFIGQTFSVEKPGEHFSPYEIIQLSINGIGLVGLGLAWKWELMGGIIALVAFIVLTIINPIVLKFPLLFIWPIIAILFIMLWVISRNTIVKNS